MAARIEPVRPRLYTVPAGQPFLTALARALLAGNLPVPGGRSPSPLELTDVTVILPTNRAARALQDAFLASAAGTTRPVPAATAKSHAMLLPRIRPIAEAEEEAGLLHGLAGALGGGEAVLADVPPAVGELERRLVLMQLVGRWSEARRGALEAAGEGAFDPVQPRRTPAQAAHLGDELGRLMDQVETEGVSLAGLKDLVPGQFSEHWQQTIEFLQIVTEWWPGYLAAQGRISPMDRRYRLILAESRRLAATPPPGPVIVAGVTGSIPATAELMRVVARLPHGAIVLPGLDTVLDEASWQAIGGSGADEAGHPEHPQHSLKKLLDALGVVRHEVAVLPGAEPDAAAQARAQVVSEAMRPSGTTERWHAFAARAAGAQLRRGLVGITCLEAAGAEEEAEAVALILRQVAEEPGRTAALVSPDRLLARRVAVRLAAWGLKVDDSAGRPFAKTPPGAFLDLVIAAFARRFAPPELMALLKHPLARLGLPPGAGRRAARALELLVFRGLYLGDGIDGIAAALAAAERDLGSAGEGGERRSGPARRIGDRDRQAAGQLVARLKEAFAPLAELARIGGAEGKHPLRALVRAHVAAAEALARDDSGSHDELWAEEAGEQAAQLLAGLMDEQLPEAELRIADYPDLYRCLLQGEVVRPRVAVHPRIFIWGPFEARLQHTDVMVLGSLNEGTWPAAADPGPWLNRPMRRSLGLPSPEERIGQAAHDFATFLGARTVYLTRAAKIGGVPTVPSRWLMRLEAVLAGLGLAGALTPPADRPWLAWARARDVVAARRQISAPAPAPPVAARPRRMSVTAVERWIANPYAIFAGHILRLEALPPLGPEPDASLRGRIVHEALSRFSSMHPANLPHDTADVLMQIADGVLSDFAAHTRIAAFWRPRLARFARWFAETEPARRAGCNRLVTEVRGSRTIEAPAGAFKLTARADRLDLAADGSLVITDYKTGSLPPESAVLQGFAPQLPLEAAIALAQGFEGVPADRLAALRFIRATGGEPAGEERLITAADLGRSAEETFAKLSRLVAQFDRPETPYTAVRRAGFSYDYDNLAHLARVGEWQAESMEEPK